MKLRILIINYLFDITRRRCDASSVDFLHFRFKCVIVVSVHFAVIRTSASIAAVRARAWTAIVVRYLKTLIFSSGVNVIVRRTRLRIQISRTLIGTSFNCS